MNWSCKKEILLSLIVRELAKYGKNSFCNLRNGYLKGINQRNDKKLVNYFAATKYNYPL